jgi:hypothetical protein
MAEFCDNLSHEFRLKKENGKEKAMIRDSEAGNVLEQLLPADDADCTPCDDHHEEGKI